VRRSGRLPAEGHAPRMGSSAEDRSREVGQRSREGPARAAHRPSASPRDSWLRADFASGLRDPLKLAKKYDVSPAAMGFRLRNLALI